jgi:N utilization substance protein B
LLENQINNWSLNDDYILLLNDVKASDLYANYMSNSVNTFEEDRQFIVDLFMEVIVPNEKLYEYLEDDKLTWVDDIPETHIIKQLKAIKSGENDNFRVLYKDNEDKDFVKDLFRKTVLNEADLPKNIWIKRQLGYRTYC